MLTVHAGDDRLFEAIRGGAVGYVLSRESLLVPRYVRLGKFMSKARVMVQESPVEEAELDQVIIPFLLNPADLPREMPLTVFDLISVPPTPLVRNALLSGRFYRLKDKTLLPVGMRFGVEGLPSR